MPDVSPTALMAAAKCFACLPPEQLQPIRVELLVQILLASNPVANVSPTALLAAGKCFACLAPKDLKVIEVQLLSEILTGGGGGGGTGNVCLIAASGAPVAPCAFNFGIAFDNDKNSPTAGGFWWWDAPDAQWVKFG